MDGATCGTLESETGGQLGTAEDTNVEYDERFCLYMTSRLGEQLLRTNQWSYVPMPSKTRPLSNNHWIFPQTCQCWLDSHMMHVTAAAFESQKKVLKFICWGPPCLTMSSNELAILEEFEQRFQRLESTVKMLIWTSCARTCQCLSPFLERSCNHWTSYLPGSGNLRYCWESLSKSRGNYEVRPT